MDFSNTSKTPCVIRMRDNQSSFISNSGAEQTHGRVIEYIDKSYVATGDGNYSLDEAVLEGKPEKIWKLLETYNGLTLPELKKKSEEAGGSICSLTPFDAEDDPARANNEAKYPFYRIVIIDNSNSDPFPKSFRLETSNLMGVLTLADENGVSLTLQVESRFDKTKKQPFLLYMLEKVFDFNLTDHEAESIGESWLNEILLCFAFLRGLENAAKVGLYKKYERVKYNDLRFRGRLDFARHIRKNFPVQDKIAYSRREITFDHCVNHLIRSAAVALEKLFSGFSNMRKGDAGQAVRGFLRDLKTNTPSWQPGLDSTRRLLRHRDALEPVRHSYFAETYEELRILSRMILEKETGSPYGNTGGYVSGILFDGAWLWEEYLATVLAEVRFKDECGEEEPDEFVHSTPLTPRGAIYAFYKDEEQAAPNRRCYPDFYWKVHKILLDAKYKRGTDIGDSGQILVYLLLTGAKRVGLVYPPPTSVDKEVDKEVDKKNGALTEYTIRQQLDRDENGPKKDYVWQSYQFDKIPLFNGSNAKEIFKETYVFMKEEEGKLRDWVKDLGKRQLPSTN